MPARIQWPWTSEELEARLLCNRFFPRPPRGPGCPAVQRGHPVPWGQWALRWADLLGLADLAPDLAAGIDALVSCHEGPGWPAALRGLRSLLGEDGLAGAVGEVLVVALGRPEARWPQNPSAGLRPGAAPSAPVREATLCLGLPVAVAGGDIHAVFDFADALATLVALLTALERWWLALPPPLAGPILLDPLLDAALQREGSDLLGAVAGYRHQREQSVRVRRVLSRAAVMGHLDERWSAALQRARALRPAASAGPLDALLDGLEQQFQRCTAVARFWSLGAMLHPAAGWVGALERDLDLARTYLATGQNWPESWEVRERGLAHGEQRLVSAWFHRGFILRVLDDTGPLGSRVLEDWLGEPPPGPLRWYGDWQGIPPDVDSLGLALELASRRRSFSRQRVERWLRPLQASLSAAGEIPVWFHRDASGYSTDDPRLEYLGNDCTAAIMGTLLGMLLYGLPSMEDLVHDNLGRLMDRYRDDGFAGVYFYDPAYADHLFLRIHAWAARATDPPPWRQRAAGIARRIVQRILAHQRLDGGWGGPQRTGWYLTCLAHSRGVGGASLARGARYLSAWQQPDGSWPAEPFYLMPGRDGGVAWHRGTALTSAVCTAGLHMALVAVKSQDTL